MKATPLFAILLFSGCSLIAPGPDAREGLAARQKTTYDEAGNFITDESTTHERNNVVIEGDNITAEFGPDGKLKTLTGATNVMVQVSRPRDAADVLQERDLLNAQIGLRALDVLDRLSALIPAPGGVGVSGAITTKPKPVEE